MNKLRMITIITSVAAFGFIESGAAENAGAPAEAVALEFKLPKPMFVGTPKVPKIVDLEPPFGETPPKPLRVPVGCVNLALKKKVTSSDKEPVIGELSLVTDGDKEGAEGSYVELAPGSQWIQIDLGRSCTVYAIVFWHFHSEVRVYKDVIIQISDDPDFIQNVRTVFNNDRSNASGLGIGRDRPYVEEFYGKRIAVDGVKGRYIRLYSNGNTSNPMNHYTEVEVYGK